MTDFGLYWWRPKRGWTNLGDEISPLVLGHVTGRRICHAAEDRCDGIAIGSVFHPRRARAGRRLRPLFIWGSGTLEPSPCDFGALSILPAALRGPRTHGQILGCPDLPYGDPGLFLREIWPAKAPNSGGVGAGATRGGGIGLIPHHSQLRSPRLQGLSEALEGAEVLDFTAPDIAGTVARLSRCRLIVSSSLHGLVIADSYGIPSLFWHEGEAAEEWKYRDYFEGAGRADFAALPAARICEIARAGRVEDLPFSCLSKARLTSVLDGLRAAARAMPEGSFPRTDGG